ncbi:MAG: cache domain-containing protein [Candidatus Spechtbacterales bacterium]|nr:cache domain-containing protein [Candidatus Spechtbacterales bacterium]
MNIFFLFNNIHFTLEVLGALSFLIVAWLALDSFLVRRDFTTISRGIGFGFLGAWQAIHAFGYNADIYGYTAYAFLFSGILFVIWNLMLEAPTDRPEFKAILILPALTPIIPTLNGIAAIGFGIIAFLGYRQFKKEQKKTLIPFATSFFALALAYGLGVFYEAGSFGNIWVIAHLFEFIGFLALAIWVWQYLQLRIREELLLIFVAITLLMAAIVTLTFSTILVDRVAEQSERQLLTNAKVANLAIEHMEKEALAKARFISTNNELISAVAENDFASIEDIATRVLKMENLGFLTILDNKGNVLLRAHGVTKKGDNLATEPVVAAALINNDASTLGYSETEGFSIRTASAMNTEEGIVGVVLAGFQLDNAFVDSMKELTGLGMSVFLGNRRVATTNFKPDGRSRSTGIQITDNRIIDTVIEQGNSITLSTEITSQPFLASYLPLYNIEGDIVGMLSAERSQQEIVDLTNSTNKLTLVSVMALMLILITPIYLATKRLAGEVK